MRVNKKNQLCWSSFGCLEFMLEVRVWSGLELIAFIWRVTFLFGGGNVEIEIVQPELCCLIILEWMLE